VLVLRVGLFLEEEKPAFDNCVGVSVQGVDDDFLGVGGVGLYSCLYLVDFI
jgi:hypothetical protein